MSNGNQPMQSDLYNRVVSLSMLPFLRRQEPMSAMSSQTSLNSSDPDGRTASYPRRLVEYLAAEVCHLLSWELRINTVVHFNEVGKSNGRGQADRTDGDLPDAYMRQARQRIFATTWTCAMCLSL